MSRKTHHYIYKIVCNITGNFYVGKHTTHTLENDYFGSGKLIKYSIRKYDKNNHTKTILEVVETLDELNKRELEIVNEELLKNPKCLNLVLGGSGSWQGISKLASSKGTLFTQGMLGKKHSEASKKLMSEHGTGKNNSQYGLRVYVNPTTGQKSKRIAIRPEGWLLVSEWLERNKSAKYGGTKHWYNDGVNDYFLDENKATHLNVGRLNNTFKQRKLG